MCETISPSGGFLLIVTFVGRLRNYAEKSGGAHGAWVTEASQQHGLRVVGNAEIG